MPGHQDCRPSDLPFSKFDQQIKTVLAREMLIYQEATIGWQIFLAQERFSVFVEPDSIPSSSSENLRESRTAASSSITSTTGEIVIASGRLASLSLCYHR